MNRLWYLTFVCTAVLSAGCQEPPGGEKINAAASHDQQLTSQIEALKAQNTIQASQLLEVRRREDVLIEKVRKLQFLCRQQEKQIKLLSNAPPERDKYKAQVKKLNARIEQLIGRIGQLQADNKLLRLKSTTPATEPKTNAEEY